MRVISAGTQTLSRAPSQLVNGASRKFLRPGRGSRVWHIDYPMAPAPILFDNGPPAVTAAVVA